MSELVFTFHNEPWELPLHLTTSFTREFGEDTTTGWEPFDFSASSFEMLFGIARDDTIGAPVLKLDTANGDLVPGIGGALTFVFRSTRIGGLIANTKYFVEINRLVGGETAPFGKGIVVGYRAPRA